MRGSAISSVILSQDELISSAHIVNNTILLLVLSESVIGNISDQVSTLRVKPLIFNTT